MEDRKPVKKPCQQCLVRKAHAKSFGRNFSGDDCPYICEAYEYWKQDREQRGLAIEMNDSSGDGNMKPNDISENGGEFVYKG